MRIRPVRLVLVVSVAFAAGAIVSAEPTFRSGTASVFVDAVVKNRKGVSVPDLTVGDFTILEDGVPQTIERFHFVQSGHSPDAPALVALAFEPLSSEAQALALKGVDQYLETAGPSDYTGVFRVGDNMQLLQWFTTDADAVRRAVRRLVARPRSQAPPAMRATVSVPPPPPPREPPTVRFYMRIDIVHEVYRDGKLVSRTESVTESGSETGGDEPSSGTAGGVGNNEAGEAFWRPRIERMEAQVSALADSGRMRGLLALVEALGELPGRKTVILFAEGESLASERARQLRDAVVAGANRSNVAIYALDTGGLRTLGARTELAAHVAEQSNYLAGIERDPTKPWTMDLERNEALLQDSAATSMAVLSERTGGFLLSDTNDFRKGLTAIAADRHAYYLLRYTPRNTDFQGEYRRIEIKLRNRDLVVRGRQGYLAVPASVGGPVLLHEAPALALLDRSVLPQDFPVKGAAIVTPRTNALSPVSVFVRVPSERLRQSAATVAALKAPLTILGVVRNATGEAVHKVSGEQPLIPPNSAEPSPFVFTRHLELPAGTYSFDYIVYDPNGRQAGAGRTDSFLVPRAGDKLAVGSLMIVESSEPARSPRRSPQHSLQWGDLLLRPGLGDPVRTSGSGTVSFWLPIASMDDESLSADVQLLKDGEPAGAAPLHVPKPDQTGRTAIANQLPTASLPPGSYKLRVTVRARGEDHVREVSFTLVP